jgi:hypothetical protein
MLRILMDLMLLPTLKFAEDNDRSLRLNFGRRNGSYR